MPYVERRFNQPPFHAGAYIQRGGGIFSAMSDLAKRYVMPFFTTAGKTAISGLSKAAKSKATKTIVNKAKDAVEQGLYDAGGKILQGENIGNAIKSSSSKTKEKIQDAMQTEAKKVGTNLRKRAANIDEVPSKKAKKEPKTVSKQKSKTKKKKVVNNPVKFKSLL